MNWPKLMTASFDILTRTLPFLTRLVSVATDQTAHFCSTPHQFPPVFCCSIYNGDRIVLHILPQRSISSFDAAQSHTYQSIAPGRSRQRICCSESDVDYLLQGE